MKIIDKIKKSVAASEKVFSFEFFPPKTSNGVKNLYVRINRLSNLEPTWIDVTWGAGGKTGELTLDIAVNAQKYCGVDVLMHLTCTGMTKEKLRKVLQQAKDQGIQNILALRGDKSRGTHKWTQCEGGCNGAKELVEFIRAEFGDHFCIAVAGYPEGWDGEEGYKKDVDWLKQKVDAGADFAITQLFYRAEAYKTFLADCKSAGIDVPIIPGIMPIQSYHAFQTMTTYCKCTVPPSLTDKLVATKDNDEATRKVGIEEVTKICNACLEAGAPGLHFYTLNLERSVREIIGNVNLGAGEEGPAKAPLEAPAAPSSQQLTPEAPSPTLSAAEGKAWYDGAAKKNENLIDRAATRRKFPWRASALSNRADESVRPIFWANRPKSYMARTETWDEYPNGRWGDANSPAFGDLAETHFFHFNSGSKAERKAQWNEAPLSAADVNEVFAQYVEGKVTRLPWCTEALQLETGPILNRLANLNRHGFLTINSQPSINAVESTDPVFGWGEAGGRIYQKAYIEFFVSPRKVGKFMSTTEENKKNTLTYHAIDIAGNSYTNCQTGAACAVTWGIFPGREAIQPTVVDPEAFAVWKDEAFSLWLSEWASLYNDESKSSELIHEIYKSYYLVNIVDNNFINGDIFEIFEQLIANDGGESESSTTSV